jgi:hypothetical protein
MDIDVLKKELQGLELPNLYIVQNGQYIDAINTVAKKSFIDMEKSGIIAYLDKEPSIKGNDGILVVSDGIVWSFDGATIDDKNSQYGSSCNFESLKSFEVSISENLITLIRRDISPGKDLEIFFPFTEADKAKKQEYAKSLERFFNSIVSFSGIDGGEVPDEKNGVLIREYIGPSVFYMKAFNKYCVNGIDKFAFNFSWGGLIFGILNMLHRKLYIEVLVAFLVCGVLSIMQLWYVNILTALTFAIINPFLVYKRYKRILNQCAAKKMNMQQKKESLSALGGTNIVTTILGSILFLIGIIIGIIFLVRSCV